MAQPVYKAWLVKFKEPWYHLTTEEQNKLFAQIGESLKKLGAEVLVSVTSLWASEEWDGWGVEKYPDIEAVQKHAQFLYDMKWFVYIESRTYLGTEMPQM